METLFEGGFRNILVVGHIPVEIFLLVNYFFDAKLTSYWMFFEGKANFL